MTGRVRVGLFAVLLWARPALAGTKTIDFDAATVEQLNAAFNAGTSNQVNVGTNAGSDNNIVNNADVDELTIATTEVTRGLGLSITSDTTVYVTYIQSGTAATAGIATIIVEYVPNNDQ